jgi:hypothetical protein
LADSLYPQVRAGTVLQIPTDSVEESPPVPIHYDSSESRTTSMDIGAKLLSLISLGLSGDHKNTTDVTYESAGMTQLEFEPATEYVSSSLGQEDVREYIRSHSTVFGSLPLYMVVGLRIAHGATFKYSRGRTTGGGVEASTVGLSLVGVPVDPSIGIRNTMESKGSQTTTIDQDFVIAYRLKECKYSRNSGTIKSMYHTKKAAMMDTENRPATTGSTGNISDEERAGEVQITSLGLSKFDLDARTIGLDKKYVHVGDNCDCILVNEQVVESLEG